MKVRRFLKNHLVLLSVFATAQLFSVHTMTVRAGDDSGMGTNYYAGLNCGQLWYERNAIFASKGYCFKSKRGQAIFGQKSCFPPYGKLPGHLRRVVNEIKGWERRRGC
jgi:YARHG domain-containing protein